jgi:Tfp pilus assembly protein PilO
MNLKYSFLKIKQDKNFVWIVLAGCALVLYLDFSVLLRTQLAGMSAQRNKIRVLRSDLAQLQRSLAVFDKEKINQRQVLSSAKRLLLDDEIPAVMKFILDMANAAEVKIAQIKPVQQAGRQEKKKAVSRRTSSPQKPAQVRELSLMLNLTAGYHDLGVFLDTLEQSKQYLLIDNMTVASNPKKYYDHTVTMVIKTYLKKEGSAAKKDAGSARKPKK